MISVNFHNLSDELKHFCLSVVIPHEELVSNLEDRAFEQIHFLESKDPLDVPSWQFKLCCEIIQDCYNILVYINHNSCDTFGVVDNKPLEDSIHICDKQIKSIDECFTKILELYKNASHIR